MKQCTKCRQRKKPSQFNADRQKKDDKRSWCKTCHRRYSRKWSAKNPGKKKAGAAVWYRRRKQSVLESHRQRLYGVTPATWAAMVARQGNRCAVCKTATPGGKGNWHVDHDHSNGLVRELLCHQCNVGLGHFSDDIGKLRAAIQYLLKHKKSVKLER